MHTSSTNLKNGYAGYGPILFLFVVVLAASLLGIWSRPAGFLASIWPANALMLGIMLRVPGTAHWSGWVVSGLAFMLADLLTEATVFRATILNSANLVSVAIAYLILSRLPEDVKHLRQPSAIMYIVLVAVLSGAAAGLIGGASNPTLFGGSVVTGFVFWWVTEVVNYVAILPILLSAPALKDVSKISLIQHRAFRKTDVLPALAVVISCIAALIIGGPGAIAFPVLALLWCGLVYPVFPTAILTLMCSLFALTFISNSHFPIYDGNIDQAALFSIRLGTSVIAIAPILLSIVTRNRNELLSRLRYLSSHDSLTGVGSRSAFREEADRILSDARDPHAIMMIDLDHFKAINDNYGHATGDRVLCETAKCINDCLRPTDRMGRMGGEEFAVLLKNCQLEAAQEIAERIRAAIETLVVAVSDQVSVPVTASIGLTFSREGNDKTLDILLVEADTALYLSKENGRNRVEVAIPRWVEEGFVSG